VDGKKYSRPLDVLKDPNLPAVTTADIAASTGTLRALQSDMNNAADMLNTIESARSQVEAVRAGAPEIAAASDSIEQKFMNVETNLIDLRMTGRGQDEVRYPVKLGGQLNYLAGGVAVS